MITGDTWLISDTHFGHKNIVGFCHRPLNHEELMINNWAATVGHEDTILHLGDVIFSDVKYWADRLGELPGRKLLIKGNHDHTRTIKLLKERGFELVPDFTQDFSNKRIYFSHYPDPPSFEKDEWDVNIHGHIHNNGYDHKFFTQTVADKIYYNVSIEVVGYRPILLNHILRELGIPF